MKKKLPEQTQPGISIQQKYLFTIITLLIPIFFFVIFELVLRLFDYGPDLAVFQSEDIDGSSYYSLNPSVKNRYFNRIDFNPDPSPEIFLPSRPAGTYRIFCLGGSTTVGYPYWYNGAFSSFLRDRLKAQFPHRSIEIVNVGMTATNSYTVLDIGRDLVALEPDLFIVYDGHNEFYGALGVASNARITPTRWMNFVYLRLVHWRTFQLTSKIISGILTYFGEPPIEYSGRATMMEQVSIGKNVPYGSDSYKKGLVIFQKNLDALADLCDRQLIPLILGTQVSNLRDQRPFISNLASDLSDQGRLQFQRFFERGKELQSKGLSDSATVLFQSAIAIDATHADVHYHLAQCFDSLGNKQNAFSEYSLARDYDELRFRTDTQFNDAIRSMGDRPNCYVADIESAFMALSKDSLIGNNLILEHLHPNIRGTFLMAKEYAQVMCKHGLLVTTAEWAKHTVSDDSLWQHRHLTLLDELTAARKIEFLTSGWPFNDEPVAIAPVPDTDTLRSIAEKAVRNQIGWVTAHELAAEFYLKHGDLPEAEKEFKTIINQLPHNIAANLRLAQLYFDRQAFSQAEALLVAFLKIRRNPVAYRALGDIYLRQGESENAIRCYEELAQYPEDPTTAPENSYMHALAYLVQGQPHIAIRILEQTIQRFPAYRPAKDLLEQVQLHEQENPRR